MIRRLRGIHREWLTAAGIVLLAGLFLAAVSGTDPESEPVALELEALPDDQGNPSPLNEAADALILEGGRDRQVAARLKLTLPPTVRGQAPWVIWMGREPVDAIQLSAADWASPERSFFAPAADETLLPGGFLFRVPSNWQGPIELVLRARGKVRGALRPQAMRVDTAIRIDQRATVIAVSAYASLMMLALLALALFNAARDHSFLSFFGFAALAAVVLATANGHLYLLPGFSLYGVVSGNGIWALLALFGAALLQITMRYAGTHRAAPRLAENLDKASVALLLLAGLCLLPFKVIDPWLQGSATLGWASAGLMCNALLFDAVRRRVPMAYPVLTAGLLTLIAAVMAEAASRGYFVDMPWSHYGYQVAIVFSAAVIGVALISRISEYREQRDRDQHARAESERRLHREAARSEFATALQMRIRSLPERDLSWAALRLLLEHVVRVVPSSTASVVAYGYHGQDLLVVEPGERKEIVQTSITRRALSLKRLAANVLPVQHPVTVADMPGKVVTEALVPLGVRAPAWGTILLERAGGEVFGSEELAVVAEYAKIAVQQIDQAIAAINLRRTAEIDALTGSFNRRSIDQWLVRSFSEAHRDRSPLSVLFIDIDHFKSVNDQYGHACGDHCLRKLATILRGALGEGDAFGRYGGEEFIAVLPGRGGAAARVIGEQLRAAVEAQEIEWSGHLLNLTISVGVATRLENESTPDAAVARADKALYAAKHAGRNCVLVAPAVFS